jgi:hypothetical protein
MSQLYVLKILTAALTRRWVNHRDEVAAARDDVPPRSHISWVDPPPLEEPVARYILSVMMLILRQTYTPVRPIHALGHTRTGSFPNFQAIDMRGAKETTGAMYNTLYPLTPRRFPRNTVPSGPDRPMMIGESSIPPSAFVISATSFHITESPATILWLIHQFAGRVIFHLSASNWPVVSTKIRQKIHQFANGSDDRLDVMDIQLMAHSAMDRNKLLVILHGELSIQPLSTTGDDFRLVEQSYLLFWLIWGKRPRMLYLSR